jgi:hypothetical protein
MNESNRILAECSEDSVFPEKLKISLKSMFAECLKANIDTKPLSNLLLMFYGNVAVAKGQSAMIKGWLLDPPEVLKGIMIQIEEFHRTTWTLEFIVTETEDLLKAESGTYTPKGTA